MYDTIQDLLSAYRSTPIVLQALLHSYPLEQAARPPGGDKGWSVGEVVCHLRDSEEAALERTRSMRDQDHPGLSARDGAKLAIELNYATTPLDSALAAFLKFRTDHIGELTALSPAQWGRTGEHPSFGRITIQEQIQHLVAHDAIHLEQISQQLFPS